MCSTAGRGAELRRVEVESDPIPSRRETHHRFEVGFGDGPASRWEVQTILVMVDNQCTIERLLLWVTDLARNKKDLLVNLVWISWVLFFRL